MSWRVVGAGLVLVLVGCRASRPQPRALVRTESIETAWGNIRARLAGIANQAGLRDPMPSELVSPVVQRHLEQGTREALVALKEGQSELRKLSPPFAAFVASSAQKSYESLAAALPREHARDFAAGLKLELRYQEIELALDRRCLRIRDSP
jgi:hypothetical protein